MRGNEVEYRLESTTELKAVLLSYHRHAERVLQKALVDDRRARAEAAKGARRSSAAKAKTAKAARAAAAKAEAAEGAETGAAAEEKAEQAAAAARGRKQSIFDVGFDLVASAAAAMLDAVPGASDADHSDADDSDEEGPPAGGGGGSAAEADAEQEQAAEKWDAQHRLEERAEGAWASGSGAGFDSFQDASDAFREPTEDRELVFTHGGRLVSQWDTPEVRAWAAAAPCPPRPLALSPRLLWPG
jgi:hypothetical protein